MAQKQNRFAAAYDQYYDQKDSNQGKAKPEKENLKDNVQSDEHVISKAENEHQKKQIAKNRFGKSAYDKYYNSSQAAFTKMDSAEGTS